ncbi:TraR/DksA C4-type zinc finger protein [Enterobacter kobei]|uniref:hypothetical protein n=1 Tax=Enterobacter kobei TaxID=208224 RepID=UPI0037095F67
MTAEIIDQASELEEMLRENAIAAHRINRNAVSAKHCESCGEDIPESRAGLLCRDARRAVTASG